MRPRQEAPTEIVGPAVRGRRAPVDPPFCWRHPRCRLGVQRLTGLAGSNRSGLSSRQGPRCTRRQEGRTADPHLAGVRSSDPDVAGDATMGGLDQASCGTAKRGTKVMKLAAWAVVALMVVACRGSTGTLPSGPCDTAFKNNETQLAGGKSSELLDEAIAACSSVADWQAAWAAHPNAHGSALDPMIYLAGRCVDFPATAVCRELTARSGSLSGALHPPNSSTIEGVPIRIPRRWTQPCLLKGRRGIACLARRSTNSAPGTSVNFPKDRHLATGRGVRNTSRRNTPRRRTRIPAPRNCSDVTVATGTPPGISIGVDDSGPC